MVPTTARAEFRCNLRTGRDGQSPYTLNSRSTWTALRTLDASRIVKTYHNLDKTMRWVFTISLVLALSACAKLKIQSPLPQDRADHV